MKDITKKDVDNLQVGDVLEYFYGNLAAVRCTTSDMYDKDIDTLASYIYKKATHWCGSGELELYQEKVYFGCYRYKAKRIKRGK